MTTEVGQATTSAVALPASARSSTTLNGLLKAAPRPSKYIQPGDLVIIFMSRDKPPIPITVTSGHESSNTYGSFLHDSMIGLPFGAKLASRNARGFVHLLRPNPELWTLALPHRTQIVYTPDMSFIAAHLGITPGARVIEAGTGSGSFSHYLTRTVGRNHAQGRGVGWKGKIAEQRIQSQRNGRGRDKDEIEKESISGDDDSEEELSKKQPSDQKEAQIMQLLSQEPDKQVDNREGRVWSFEFHAGRAVKAWNEFEDHGLFPTLSLRHRNVCKMGFGLQGMADAVFLDLPAPWEAIGHAAKALRSDVASRICCFSPCIEQVLKTVEAFRKGGSGDEDEAKWSDIETYECLNRNHMSVWAIPGGPTGNSSIEEAITRIRTVEERKGKRREAQIERVKRDRLLKLQQDDIGQVTQENAPNDLEETAPMGEKRKRDNEEAPRKEKDASVDDALVTIRTRDGKALHRANIYARTFAEMKGHTSYLTFATLLPRTVRQETAQEKEKEKEAEVAAGSNGNSSHNT